MDESKSKSRNQFLKQQDVAERIMRLKGILGFPPNIAGNGNINTGKSLNLLVPERLLKSRALFILHKALMKGSKEVC